MSQEFSDNFDYFGLNHWRIGTHLFVAVSVVAAVLWLINIKWNTKPESCIKKSDDNGNIYELSIMGNSTDRQVFPDEQGIEPV